MNDLLLYQYLGQFKSIQKLQKQTRQKYVVKVNTCIPWQLISACAILSRKDLKWVHLLCQKHLQCFFEQLCMCIKKIHKVFLEKLGIERGTYVVGITGPILYP